MAELTTWKDIDISFEMQKNGDIKADYHIDAIKNSITNILRTMKGWRRMLPEFALNAWGLIFEPMDDDTATSVGELILGAIERWEERVIVDNIHVHANYALSQYDIKITFRVKNLRTEPETIETVLKTA